MKQIFTRFILLFFIAASYAPCSAGDSYTVTTESEKAYERGALDAPDWVMMFYPKTPLLEIFVRGSFVYLGIFILLKVVLKREAGTVGMTDMLVIVLLSDASQNAMADDYRSITDGLILILTIIMWSHLLNFLGYKFRFIQRLIQPPPLSLVRNGKLLRRNMRKEFLTEEELMSQIREQGVGRLEDIKEAYMEMDGKISVLKFEGKSNGVRRDGAH